MHIGALWGNKRAKKRLEDREAGPLTTNPEVVQLGILQREVRAFFCNNAHVFCGVGGKAKVYSLNDSQSVKTWSMERR